MDGAIASGLYWVATGKLPIEDVKDEDLKGTDKREDPRSKRDKKASR